MPQLDLARLGTTAAAEEIVDTAVTQPLIVATGLIAAGQLGLARVPAHSVLSAGHSIGEVTASAVAGVLTDHEAMTFAARRGREMAAACELTPTTMAAALGGEESAVLAAIVVGRLDSGQPQRRRPDRGRRQHRGDRAAGGQRRRPASDSAP